MFLIVIVVIGCKQKTAKEMLLETHEEGIKIYEKLLQEETQKEEVYDSLFYGVRFKMTQNSFYIHCNEMHKKGVFTGNYNYQVVVKLTEGFHKPVNLTFYPRFNKPFVEYMVTEFVYDNASVFSKEDFSDKLIKEIKKEMMKWYGGNKFIELPSKYAYSRPTYVKIDGNRKITLEEDDTRTSVAAIFEDLKPLY